MYGNLYKVRQQYLEGLIILATSTSAPPDI